MTYATLAGMYARVGRTMLVDLTDRGEPATGEVDTGVVAGELALTDAVIDAFLAVRYRLPLAAVPAIVTDLALSIAIYKLHRFAPDPKVEKDYDQALRTLREIADGRVKLDLAGVAPAGSGGGGVVAIDRARPLTPETMTGFI